MSFQDNRKCYPTCPPQAICKSTGKKRPRRAADDDDDDDDEKKGKATTAVPKDGSEKDVGDKNEREIMTHQAHQAVKACGRTYLISDNLATMAEAMTYCCSKNAKLLSLDSRLKMDCLYGVLKNRPGTNIDSFWTSGSDDNCKGHFVWCSTGEFFNIMEIPVIRLTADAGKHCLTFDVDYKKKNYFLKDETCSVKQRFICD